MLSTSASPFTRSRILHSLCLGLVWLLTQLLPAVAAPGISISAPSVTSTSSGPVTYTVSYFGATAVTLSSADVTINASGMIAATKSVSGSGKTWTVTLSGISGSGTVSISIAAGTAVDSMGSLASAAGPSASFSVVVGPQVVISGPSVSQASTGPVTYTLTYLNASTITLSDTDITLNRSGTANATTSISGSGNTRTVTLSNLSGDGTLGISVAAGTATSAGGTAAPAAGPSTAFTVDNTPPAASISGPSISKTVDGPITYDVTFSGANLLDLKLSNVVVNTTGTATATASVSFLGSFYRITLSGVSGMGTLGISLTAGTASDIVGNLAPATGPSATATVTTASPTLGIAISGPSVSTTAVGPVSYTVTYTGASAITLTAADIRLNQTGMVGGTASVSGTGNTRTVTLSNIGGIGTLSISLASATAVDANGFLAGSAGPSASFTVANGPTDILIDQSSLPENNTPDTTVGTLSAVNGSMVRYALVAGTGSDDNALFHINGAKLVLSVSADFESRSAYSVRVRATDSNGIFVEKAFAISIINVDEPPIAGADSIVRTNTQPRIKIPVASLLANDSDPEQAPLDIIAVGNAQPAGATVSLSNGFILYTAPSATAGNGGFTYTLRAGMLTSAGTVTVIETAPAADSTPANAARITPQGPNIALTFIGVPGRSYRVQYSIDPGPPFTWLDFIPSAIHTAGSDTFFLHTDPAPTDPQRFYRAIAIP